MANQWFRLWHDMPTDPKFRTVARLSNQPISLVISVYLFLLVEASANASERGRTKTNASEDLASALDVEPQKIAAIIEKMQGRLLDGDVVTGWEKRQPIREDGASERAKAWREKKKEEKRTQANASERKRTLDKDKDKDKDKELNTTPNGVVVASVADDALPDATHDHPKDKKSKLPDCQHQQIIDAYHETLPTLPQVRVWNDVRKKSLQSRWREMFAAGHYATTEDGVAWWKRFFVYVSESDFLTGRVNGSKDRTPWSADLEWLVRPSNFVKVLEGKYENRQAA